MDPTEAAETAKDRGNASFKLGDFKVAEAAYTDAISLVPTSAPYHANRAAARLKLGDHVNALADATTALAIDPNHTKACLLYTSPSPRDQRGSRMPSSA